MRYTIRSGYQTLADAVAERLRSAMSHAIDVETEPTDLYALRYRPTLSPKVLAKIRRVIRPLDPEPVADTTLSACDAVLHLGDTRPLNDWPVMLFCEVEAQRKALGVRLKELGFKSPRTVTDAQIEDKVQFGGASAFALQVILWMLGEVDCIPVAVRSLEDADSNIFVSVVDPALRHRPPSERLPVEIRSDDPEIAIATCERLRGNGFGRTEVKLFTDEARKPCGDVLAVDPGPFGAAQHDLVAARLLALVGAAVAESGIDPARYPVRWAKGGASMPIVYLPARDCHSERRRPYAGPFPERFEITLLTDDRPASGALIREFTSRGFRDVTRRLLHDGTEGFHISYGALAREPMVLEVVREAVEAHMAAIGADAIPLLFSHNRSDESDEVVVKVPSAAFKKGRLIRDMQNPVLYSAVIRGGGAAMADRLARAVRRLGFTTVDASGESEGGPPRLAYGLAPRVLLEPLRAAIQELTGIDPPMIRERAVTDKAIVMVLPERGDIVADAPSGAPARASDTRNSRRRSRTGRTFLEVDDERVVIGGIALPRRRDARALHVPQIGLYRPFCLDAVTAKIMRHIAASVLYREPCALQGPTSTAKTAAILYDAALLNQPAVRLNIGAGTDAGELIGRWVPAENGGWRFHEGLLVEAMRNGWWLVLDEVNLAPADVLERLNPVLERHPALVLSEYDNSVVRPHPDFRIFCTLNPVDEYVGREAMSAAFRDRWQAYLCVARPGESEFLALGRLLVTGQQPSISLDCEVFNGYHDGDPLPRLSGVRGIDGFLRAFARFQASVDAAAEPAESGDARLGAGRRERYVFTRRGFMNSLWHMERNLASVPSERPAAAAWKAIDRYYISKLADDADRTAVRDLAAACGITTEGWRAPA